MARRLVYYVACTIDGFIAHRDGSFGGFLFEGEQFADLFDRFPETCPVHLRAHFGVTRRAQRFDTVLMGRHTYEIGVREGVTSPYAPLRQYVVSRSMQRSPDPAVTVHGGDPVELVRQLKEEDGSDIWLCGGAKLAGALAAEVDELVLKINPVMFGAGIPLFDGPEALRPARLVEHKVYNNGFVLARYFCGDSS